MRRGRVHVAGAVAALLAAVASIVVLRSVIDHGSTGATVAVLGLICVFTLVFVVEVMLAATSKPVKAPTLKTREMQTPGGLAR